jgi:hypothetical protein
LARAPLDIAAFINNPGVAVFKYGAEGELGSVDDKGNPVGIGV